MLLAIIAILCILVASIIFAKPALMDFFLSRWCEAQWNNKELLKLYKCLGFLLCDIRNKNWSELYTIHQVGVGNKKLKDESVTLRGVVWCIFGALFSVASLLIKI